MFASVDAALAGLGPGLGAQDPLAWLSRQEVAEPRQEPWERTAGPVQEEQHSHFSVIIRVRPPLERELASPAWQHVVDVTGDAELCLHEVIPEANAADRASGTAQVVTNHPFAFDRVYGEDTSQPEVYEKTARTSVASALQGYNATILAYGPTGTGKTYTMEGCGTDTSSSRGIIPRSIEEMFEHISTRHSWGPPSRFMVRASYLQIYNYVISDLLKPGRTHLLIREDRRRGVFVEGLSEWHCRSPAEVHTLMEHGSAGRATAQTAANDASSRSHAVFIVIVEQSEVLPEEWDVGESEAAGQTTEPSEGFGAGAPRQRERVRVGRLNLVDLAGSERPRLTGATGQRLEETKKINQSLSALGNVISALTERRSRQHVPYRDSKLTRLLEDSLGGNCRTTMMAMVSPAAEAFAESLSTLKFAHRAKAIRNNPKVNEDLDPRTLLRRYEVELRWLRAELQRRSNAGLPEQERERERQRQQLTDLREVQEAQRRAEEGRLSALSALAEEQVERRRLEEHVLRLQARHSLSSEVHESGDKRPAAELAGVGTPMASSGAELASAGAERLRTEYAMRLADLERERSNIEEDKAQVSRYKQLLLKQRDIMIALTQRLHERDETIMSLQDELDVRDRRIAELEEHVHTNPLAWPGEAMGPEGQQDLPAGVWPPAPRAREAASTLNNRFQKPSADRDVEELVLVLRAREQEQYLAVPSPSDPAAVPAAPAAAATAADRNQLAASAPRTRSARPSRSPLGSRRLSRGSAEGLQPAGAALPTSGLGSLFDAVGSVSSASARGSESSSGMRPKREPSLGGLVDATRRASEGSWLRAQRSAAASSATPSLANRLPRACSLASLLANSSVPAGVGRGVPEEGLGQGPGDATLGQAARAQVLAAAALHWRQGRLQSGCDAGSALAAGVAGFQGAQEAKAGQAV